MWMSSMIWQDNVKWYGYYQSKVGEVLLELECFLASSITLSAISQEMFVCV